MPTTQNRRRNQEACMHGSVNQTFLLFQLYPCNNLASSNAAWSFWWYCLCLHGQKNQRSGILQKPSISRLPLSPIASKLSHLFVYHYRTDNLFDHRIRSFYKTFAKLVFRFWKNLTDGSGLWHILKYFYILHSPSSNSFRISRENQLASRLASMIYARGIEAH